MNNLVYIVIGESDSPFVKSLNWFLRDSGQNLPGLKFHHCQNLGPSSDCTAEGVKKSLIEMVAYTFDFDPEAPSSEEIKP